MTRAACSPGARCRGGARRLLRADARASRERLGSRRRLAGGARRSVRARLGSRRCPAAATTPSSRASPSTISPPSASARCSARCSTLLAPGAIFVNMDVVAIAGPLHGPVRRADGRQRGRAEHEHGRAATPSSRARPARRVDDDDRPDTARGPARSGCATPASNRSKCTSNGPRRRWPRGWTAMAREARESERSDVMEADRDDHAGQVSPGTSTTAPNVDTRPDHAQAVPQARRAHRLRRVPLLRLGEGARLGSAGQPDPRRRRELRLRLLARACAVGAAGLRLPGDRRAELRRHLLLQLHQDRAAAGRALRRGLPGARARRPRPGRPARPGGPLRRPPGRVRDRPRDPPAPARRARRHRVTLQQDARSPPTRASASAGPAGPCDAL